MRKCLLSDVPFRISPPHISFRMLLVHIPCLLSLRITRQDSRSHDPFVGMEINLPALLLFSHLCIYTVISSIFLSLLLRSMEDASATLKLVQEKMRRVSVGICDIILTVVFFFFFLLVHINSFVHVHAAMQGLSFGIPREYEGDQSIGGTPIREILGMETVFDALQRVRADVVGYGGRKVGWVHGWVAGWPGEAVHLCFFIVI